MGRNVFFCVCVCGRVSPPPSLSPCLARQSAHLSAHWSQREVLGEHSRAPGACKSKQMCAAPEHPRTHSLRHPQMFFGDLNSHSHSFTERACRYPLLQTTTVYHSGSLGIKALLAATACAPPAEQRPLWPLVVITASLLSFTSFTKISLDVKSQITAFVPQL